MASGRLNIPKRAISLGGFMAVWICIASNAHATALSGQLTIANVRTYSDGLVVQVSQPVNAACTYPDTLELYTGTGNYSASAAFFMSAWLAGKPIRVYYDGCGSNNAASGSGNVFVTGWLVVEP